MANFLSDFIEAIDDANYGSVETFTAGVASGGRMALNHEVRVFQPLLDYGASRGLTEIELNAYTFRTYADGVRSQIIALQGSVENVAMPAFNENSERALDYMGPFANVAVETVINIDFAVPANYMPL